MPDANTAPSDHNPYGRLFAACEESRPCLDTGASVWTYAELAQRSGRVASVLRTHGVGDGDRVTVQVAKSPDAVAVYLACLRLGAVYVSLNPAYTDEEIDYFLRDATPTIHITEPDRTAASDGTPTLTLGTDGDGSLAEAAAGADPIEGWVRRRPDDWAAMLYTSGTTGHSKGAMLSCRNLCANAAALVDAWRFSPDDVLIHVLPTFHVHGLFVALHCAFGVGARVRFHARFDVDAVIDDLQRSTVLMGVPTHYHRLLGSPRLTAESSAGMRLFTSGSAPLPADEHDAFATRTGHRIVERYGMTETMILTSNPYDGDRIAGTVGFPLAGVELRIAGTDGDRAEVGETGVVEVRGDGVGLGYWGRPEATAEATTDDGWFITGDLGFVDEHGRLTLQGRGSDLIISGGLNVYPKEIELAITTLDGVEECAVIGLPDPDFGQQVCAVVVAPGGEVTADDVLAACAGLARFKHPRRIEFVDALPRNAMGKVGKNVLRERFTA